MEIVLGAIGVLIAALAWHEQRRQRKLAEQARASSAAPAPDMGAPTSPWACGIYDYPPLSSSAPGEEPTGILVDLASEMLDHMKRPYRFVHFNYDGFQGGAATLPNLIIGMFNTARRREKMAFSRPLYEIDLQGICRADQAGDVLGQLRDGRLRVAVYFGEVGWEFLLDELPDVVADKRVVVVQGGRQRDTMTHLTRKHYDVVLMDAVSCTNFLREGTNARRFKLAFVHPPKTYECCIAIQPQLADHLGAINEAIQRIRNTSWFLDREKLALRGMTECIAPRALSGTRRGSSRAI